MIVVLLSSAQECLPKSQRRRLRGDFRQQSDFYLTADCCKSVPSVRYRLSCSLPVTSYICDRLKKGKTPARVYVLKDKAVLSFPSNLELPHRSDHLSVGQPLYHSEDTTTNCHSSFWLSKAYSSNKVALINSLSRHYRISL